MIKLSTVAAAIEEHIKEYGDKEIVLVETAGGNNLGVAKSNELFITVRPIGSDYSDDKTKIAVVEKSDKNAALPSWCESDRACWNQD